MHGPDVLPTPTEVVPLPPSCLFQTTLLSSSALSTSRTSSVRPAPARSSTPSNAVRGRAVVELAKRRRIEGRRRSELSIVLLLFRVSLRGVSLRDSLETVKERQAVVVGGG